MSEQQQPVAWAFYHPNGELRFIIDDQARAEAWRSAHQGEVVPLYERPQEKQA